MNMIQSGNVNTKPIPPIVHYITNDLGYCCLWAFFTRNKRTGMIAIRLGVTDRAIRYYKARFRGGEFKCECNGNCLKEKLAQK